MAETWTVKKLIDWTTDHFKRNGIENPHLEAEILLAHAMGTERIKLYINFENVVAQKERDIFKGHIQRRIKREPTAYITGYQPFLSLNFNVTSGVLIPRPETEMLVQEAIGIAKVIGRKVRLLDIGTGSGAIAVSLAKFINDIEIVATDSSDKALEIAGVNAKKHGVTDKIIFVKADLFPSDSTKFDIIVSNPPYIRSSDIKTLQPEVRDHEPVQALDGGTDGLGIYRRMINDLLAHMNSGSFLLLEIGMGQAREISEMVRKAFPKCDIQFKKDLSGIERILIARI